MGKYVIDETTLTAIAESIRTKKGTTADITPENMPTEIASIEVGGGGYDEEYVNSLINRTVVEVDTNVEQIGANAFYGCTQLTSARIPNATVIYETAFRGCSALETVYAPRVTDLRGNAFNSCTSLTKIDLPLVEKMFAGVFTWCSNLQTLILRSDSVCSMSNTNVFNNTPIAKGTGYVYVPDNLVEQYKAATNWSTYADQIKPLSELEV